MRALRNPAGSKTATTIFKLLGRRYPVAARRAAEPGQFATVNELAELVVGAAADRVMEAIRPALQARLRWDFEGAGAADGDHGDRRVVFMHIMKTGGNSFSQLCSDWVLPGKARRGLYIDDLLLTPPAMLSRLDFIGGHLPYEALDLIPGRFRTVTLLRDPVDRTISHYMELRRSGPPYEDMSLARFIESDAGRVVARNYQARQLAHRVGVTDAWCSYSPASRIRALTSQPARYPLQALFDSTPIDMSDDELFETARRNLGAIDFVGVTENMVDLAGRLAQTVNGSVREVPRLHVSPPFDRSQLTRSLRQTIEALTAVDRELYDLAAGPGVSTMA